MSARSFEARLPNFVVVEVRALTCRLGNLKPQTKDFGFHAFKA